MTVELLHHTPLWVASHATRTCWNSHDKSDTPKREDGLLEPKCGIADKNLIYRVGNKYKHQSILEHLVYNLNVDGISRACLQELARHRIASYSVKSTRYTLKELKNEEPFTDYTDIDVQEYKKDGRERAEKYLVMTLDERVNRMSILALDNLRDLLNEGISNDIAKYSLPESYKTSLVFTINARSLQNFLSLRSSKSALWEIRQLANEIFNQLPVEHKYLFEECMYKEEKNNDT